MAMPFSFLYSPKILRCCQMHLLLADSPIMFSIVNTHLRHPTQSFIALTSMLDKLTSPWVRGLVSLQATAESSDVVSALNTMERLSARVSLDGIECSIDLCAGAEKDCLYLRGTDKESYFVAAQYLTNSNTLKVSQFRFIARTSAPIARRAEVSAVRRADNPLITAAPFFILYAAGNQASNEGIQRIDSTDIEGGLLYVIRTKQILERSNMSLNIGCVSAAPLSLLHVLYSTSEILFCSLYRLRRFERC